MRDDVKAAILRAADFLEKNPDRRLIGMLSATQGIVRCSPTDSRAFNWCALGRVAKELNIGYVNSEQEVYNQLKERAVPMFYRVNDTAEDTEQVVDWMRALVRHDHE